MKTTKRSVKKIIQAQIEKEQARIEEHSQILEIIKANEGKQFNLRTFNARTLGEKFNFQSRCGMFYIEGSESHLIGYHSTPEVNAEKFKDWDTRNGSAAKERIERLKSLDIDKVVKQFKAIEKHWEGLREAFGDVEREALGSFHNPIYYELLRNIEGEKTTRNENELYKMYYLRK